MSTDSKYILHGVFTGGIVGRLKRENEMNRDEIEAEQYGLAISDDDLFIEAIGPDGFSSHPEYPRPELFGVRPIARMREFDAAIVQALREAYESDDGAAFLAVIKGYSERYIAGFVDDLVERRQEAFAQELMDTIDGRGEYDRDRMLDKLEDGK